LTLRYEDFVANPEKSAREILQFIGEQPTESPFVQSNIVMMQQTHTVHGNPMRFTTDALTIQSDDEWKQKLSLYQKAVIAGLTLPMMLYLGYRP
jgi:hypothetical protein